MVMTIFAQPTDFPKLSGTYLGQKPPGGTPEPFADLYINFRGRNGSWTDAVDLDKSINSDEHEIYPRVPREGKYLFFISIKARKPQMIWVDAKIIEEMRPKM